MKRLLVLRHAKSSWDDPSLDDIDRPLSKRGRRAAEMIGAQMAKAGWKPELVLCSSARRARETLKRVEKCFGEILPARVEEALYDAGAEDLLKRVRNVEDECSSLLIIGHNPAMQEFVTRIIGTGDLVGRDRLLEKFPTGAIAVIRCELDTWRHLVPGGGLLEDYVCPRDLVD